MEIDSDDDRKSSIGAEILENNLGIGALRYTFLASRFGEAGRP